jgi:hypothetical protein
MPRLIDANALNLEYEVDMADDWKTAHEMANIVKYAPTVDAVPVIRCKDCARNPKNGKSRTICPCPMDRYMGDEGYCSKAEPK